MITKTPQGGSRKIGMEFILNIKKIICSIVGEEISKNLV